MTDYLRYILVTYNLVECVITNVKLSHCGTKPIEICSSLQDGLHKLLLMASLNM